MIYFASYFALFFALGALIGFFFGYVYRSQASRPLPRAREAAEPESVTPTPDGALAAMPGMSDTLAGALAARGVHDLDALRQVGRADGGVEELAEALRLEDFTIRRWITLAELQEIDGIDADLANALLRVGVRSKADLSGANADRVQHKLSALSEAESIPQVVPTRQQVVDLIARASGAS